MATKLGRCSTVKEGDTYNCRQNRNRNLLLTQGKEEGSKMGGDGTAGEKKGDGEEKAGKRGAPRRSGTLRQQKRIPLPPELSGRRGEKDGGYLLSRLRSTIGAAELNCPVRKRTAATYSPACAVPSARRSLTALFGMGRGGTSAQKPPQWDAENEHEARRRKRNALEWRRKKHAGN